MLKRLEMRNFKQHKAFDLDFTGGLNAVQGENGSGKSTILKAILFARFGVSAAGASDHLTNYDSDKGMSVKLVEYLPGLGEVTVERSLTKARVTTTEGALLATGHGPVTRFFEDRLGMPFRVFKTLLYAEQGKVQDLLVLGPTGLQKHLETIANVDTVDRVLKLIGDDIKSCEGELRGIGEIADIAELKTQYVADEHEAGVRKLDLDLYEGKVSDTSMALEKLRAEYERGLKAILESGKLKSEIAGVAASIETSSEHLTKIRAVQRNPVSPQELEDLENKFQKSAADYHRRALTLNEYRAAQQRYKQSSEFIDKCYNYGGMLAKYTQFKSDCDIKRDLELAANNKAAEAALSVKNASCPTCKRPFEQADLSQLELARQKAVLAAATATDARRDALAKMEKYSVSVGVQSWDKVRSDYLLAERMKEELLVPVLDYDWKSEEEAEISIAAALDKMKKLEQEVKQLGLDLQAYQTWIDDMRYLEREIETKHEKAEFLMTQFLECKTPTDEELKDVKIRMDKTNEEHGILLKQRSDIKEKLITLEFRLKALQSTIMTETDKKARVEKLTDENSKRLDLQKYLRDNRSAFTSDSWLALTTYVSHLLSSVTDGFLADLRREANGEFYVSEAGRPIPVEEVSGARKTIVGLCLRLGLAHLFYGQEGVVLLDEVTADCSEANSARVAGMLRSLKSQVIMVTHRQADALNAHNTIALT